MLWQAFTNIFFWVPGGFELFIGANGMDLSVGVRLLSGETLLQEKKSTGRRWDLNPGPCK